MCHKSAATWGRRHPVFQSFEQNKFSSKVLSNRKQKKHAVEITNRRMPHNRDKLSILTWSSAVQVRRRSSPMAKCASQSTDFFCIFYSIKNGPRLKLRNPIWIPLKASVDLIFCRFLSRRIDFSRKLNHSPLWIVAWGHLIMYLYILLCKLTITFQGMKTLSSLKLYRSRNNNVYRRSFIAYLIKSLFSSQPYSIARSTYHCLMLVSAYRIAQFLDCCLQLSQCLKMRTTVDL